jgi:hypothetical protein
VSDVVRDPEAEKAATWRAEARAQRARAQLRRAALSPEWAAATDVDAWAEWLGAMDEARNVFDATDEATTVLTIDVETLAARIAERLLAQ